MLIHTTSNNAQLSSQQHYLSEPEPENNPSIEEWTKKLWYIYTMEYYTVDKNNYVLKFMCKFMGLENILKEWVNPEPEWKIYVLLCGFET